MQRVEDTFEDKVFSSDWRHKKVYNYEQIYFFDPLNHSEI